MTVNDLKVGYVVETKGKGFFILMPCDDTCVFVNTETKLSLNIDAYTEDLRTKERNKNLDIMKVYGYAHTPQMVNHIGPKSRTLLWCRTEDEESIVVDYLRRTNKYCF